MGRLRIATLGLGLLGMFATVAAPAVASADPTVEASTQKVAVVRVTLQEADGSIVRAPVKAVPFGDEVVFSVQSDRHEHLIKIRPDSDTGTVRAAVTYARDGSVIANDRQVEVDARNKVVHADRGAKISVAVTPTTVHVQAR